MATKKNRKQLEMHRTPPQPRRRSLFQTAGEVSKPFLITIITFVAILALLLLLLFSKQFVGRALYTGLEGTAGLEVGPVVEGQPFIAIVKANIGAKQTSTFGFTLDLPKELSCDQLQLEGLLPNALIETLKCENGQIIYTYATAGSPYTGEIKMVQIAFKPLAVGSYSLKFSQFDIIDAQNNIISLEILDPAIDVLPKAVCGDGKVEGDEACDDGNKDSNDGCDEACQIENGWACSGEPSTCTKVQQCPPNLECCDGITPVDFQTDKTNCGQCGKVCEGLQSCVAGKCTAQCTGETPDTCGGNCVNLQKDSLNCGQCNKVCVDPYVCLKGECSENVIIYAPCTLNTDCKGGYECKSGVCKEKAESPSQQCSSDNDCLSGYECKNNVCTIKSAAQLPGSGALPPSAETVQGKKVILTEIAPTNNVFSTLITATEDFTSEVLVYTVLYGADNKVLSLQTEKIVGGLKKGSSYTATVNYLQSNVKKKTVLLYDVEANPQVHALLEKTYG